MFYSICRKRIISVAALILLAAIQSPTLFAQATAPSPVLVQNTVGEKVPSEDAIIPDFHSLGLINGRYNIFRCASPIRDLAKKAGASTDNPETMSQATARMKHLHDLGIRTIVSFVGPDKEDMPGKTTDAPASRSPYAIEKAAAEAAGITFISHPMSNSGPNSIQTISDDELFTWLENVERDIFKSAAEGGVAYHCSAGHDRTGIVSAYLRLKYGKWPLDQAIAEMRRYGHNWPKYSANGGISSWHEERLTMIAQRLAAPKPEDK